jgi:hypothetical protein
MVLKNDVPQSIVVRPLDFEMHQGAINKCHQQLSQQSQE